MTETNAARSVRTLGGRYELGEFIGQGGMATVYRGLDTKLGRQVAIKVMKADLSEDETFRERFRQEAQSAARMAHPTIVRVLDAGDDLIQTADGPKRLPFIVMEYVDGKNLRQHLTEGRVSVDEACRITDAVLTALEYSHRAGIVHRDIKPANIMITSTGRVKVMDFGIARAVSETSSTLQQTTQILGTAAYFSPEQAKGESVDARTDLYATGVLLYEMLTGTVPFRGDTAVAVAYQHVSERPLPPRERDESISEPLNRTVLHALIKDRTRRFQTAGEFRQALQAALAGRMPDIDPAAAQAPVAATNPPLSGSEMAMRQLAAGANNRAQSRPPVLWVWAAIVTVIAVVAAVGFWLFNLAPREIIPSNIRTVPDVVGVAQKDAVRDLEKLELKVVLIEESSEEHEAGLVTRTEPRSGTKLVVGDSITVYVSAGPDSVLMPDLLGLSLDDAEASLQQLGLSVGTITEEDDPISAKGRVLSSAPAAGERVAKGEAIAVAISSGQVTVPDVKGQSLQAARSLLDGLGLKITPQPRSCEITSEGLPVIEQSLLGKVEQRSEIVLVYCAGATQQGLDPDPGTGN